MTTNKGQKALTDGTTIQEAIALARTGEFTLNTFFGDELNDMESEVWDEFSDVDDMEGVKPRLPQIAIVHQAELFKMPDDTKVESFDAWCIDHNPVNGWWKIAFDESGGGSPPDCGSNDAITPNPDCNDKQADSCLICGLNQFGSEVSKDGTPGRGKACKNMRRVHMVIPGSGIPHRLTLSPGNLRPWNDFMTQQVRGKRLKLLAILVHFELIPAQNQDGIKYSELMLSVVKDPETGKPVILAKTQAQAAQLKVFREEWLEAMRGQEIRLHEMQHPDEVYDPQYTGTGEVQRDKDGAVSAQDLIDMNVATKSNDEAPF